MNYIFKVFRQNTIFITLIISASILWSGLPNVYAIDYCDGLVNNFDYNNDGILDNLDTLYLHGVSEGLNLCPQGKICDIGFNVIQENETGSNVTQVDIEIFLFLIQNGYFPGVDFVYYTLEDFCPTEPVGAPYDVSLDPCFLSQLDYDDNGVVDMEDWRWVSREVWEGGLECPDGKICSFNYYGQCNEDYQVADSINLGYLILGHTTLEEFKAQIGQCYDVECVEQPTECSDINAFDYDDDGDVDVHDANWLARQQRYGSTGACDGTQFPTRRPGVTMCCPEGKICDLYCGRNDYSEGIVGYEDFLILVNYLKVGQVPDRVCQAGVELCEESQYETEYIRYFGVRYFLPGENRIGPVRGVSSKEVESMLAKYK